LAWVLFVITLVLSLLVLWSSKRWVHYIGMNR
jgi:multiple sugar transport system permease protein